MFFFSLSKWDKCCEKFQLLLLIIALKVTQKTFLIVKLNFLAIIRFWVKNVKIALGDFLCSVQNCLTDTCCSYYALHIKMSCSTFVNKFTLAIHHDKMCNVNLLIDFWYRIWQSACRISSNHEWDFWNRTKLSVKVKMHRGQTRIFKRTNVENQTTFRSENLMSWIQANQPTDQTFIAEHVLKIHIVALIHLHLNITLSWFWTNA